MNDHIPDATKMISDTPRTDEQINGKPCTQFGILAGDSLRNAAVPSEFARQLERELTTAQDHIKRLEEAGNQMELVLISFQIFSDFRKSDSIRASLNWNKAKEAKP
jgi:hypothetical protein